jgi:hypothetical protein
VERLPTRTAATRCLRRLHHHLEQRNGGGKARTRKFNVLGISSLLLMLQEGCLHLLISLLQMAVRLMRFRMRGKSQIPLSGTRIPSVLQWIFFKKQQSMPIDLFLEIFFKNLL